MEQPEETVRDSMIDLIENIEFEFTKLKNEIKALQEKLNRAEFERDEWRKVAER